MSGPVPQLVALAQRRDLVAEEGQWSEAFVYWFDALMPPDVREVGSADQALEYFSSDGTPHNPAGEGFVDRAAKTAISFLLKVKEA